SPVQLWNQMGCQFQMNHQSYINQQIPESYPQQFHIPLTSFMPANNLRPMNPPSFPILRPPNENVNCSQYISLNRYPLAYAPQNNNVPSASTVYPQALFPTYLIPTHYPMPSVPSTVANQPKIPQEPPVTHPDLKEQIQSHQTQDTKIDEGTVATSQPTIAQSVQQSNLCAPIISSRKKRRQKKKSPYPLNSILHKSEKVSTQSITSATTMSSISSTIITTENRAIESSTTNTVKSSVKSKNKIKKQTEIPQQSPVILAASSNIQTDKSDNQISTMNEEISKTSLKSQQTLSNTTTIINDEKPLVSPKKRFHYDLQELLLIRDRSGPFSVPQRLIGLDIVINRCDNNNNNTNDSFTNTNSQKRVNRSCLQKSLGTNRQSLKHDQNNPRLTSDLSHKIENHVSTKADFSNQVAKPYIPVDQNKIEADNRFLCDVTSIVNKLTPQTYDQLQKQLAALDFDCYEKLEGMIMILHSKKHVDIIDKDGSSKKYTLRPLLMICCKKEFVNFDIQEIEYEKRKLELEAITDEKKHQEQAETLEDLIKARRRKLGNIV
ncbi:unnamed protein product, partial [Rotaria sp. Silwood2]